MPGCGHGSRTRLRALKPHGGYPPANESQGILKGWSDLACMSKRLPLFYLIGQEQQMAKEHHKQASSGKEY